MLLNLLPEVPVEEAAEEVEEVLPVGVVGAASLLECAAAALAPMLLPCSMFMMFSWRPGYHNTSEYSLKTICSTRYKPTRRT